MHISGVVVSKSEFQSIGHKTFSERREYGYALHFW